jgi:thiamine biosynthesis lipoprotein
VEVSGRTRVIDVMGTMVSIDVRDATLPAGLLDSVADWLHEVDARFSPYRVDSEISRIAEGRLHEAGAHPDVRAILRFADDLAVRSSGAFDVRTWRSDGRLDPSGIVKGWSIQVAADRMTEAGLGDFAINAGGDIVARGGPLPGIPWRVGIRHPDLAERVAAVLTVTDAAVATSGAYERGPHIVDPRTGRSPTTLRSVTVIGPDLMRADAFATAGFVMGPYALDWVARQPGYGAYVIDGDDRVTWTPGLERLLGR